MTLEVVLVAIGFSFSLLTAYIADRKNRGPAWGIAGFLFWPVALPWVLAVPALPAEESIARATHNDDTVVRIAVGAMLVCVLGIAFDVWVLWATG